MTARPAASGERSAPRPTRVFQIELSRPLPAVPALDPVTGRHHTRALALVRMHTRPLGLVELAMEGGGLDPAACAQRIWAALGPAIAAHVANDGRPAPVSLPDGALAR